MTLAPVAAPAQAGVALPLPPVGWGEDEARVALAAAAPLLPDGLPGRGHAVLVSALTTVVLRAGSLAVKVYPPGTDVEHLRRLARELAGSRTAHPPLGEPVETPHGVVTLAPWLVAGEGVDWPTLGALLATFHAEHAAADVPDWAPLSRLAGQVGDLSRGAAEVLLTTRDRLLDELRDIRSELAPGVIHGDVSPSNVMATPHGPRLIDVDWVARAPREYDLAAAARRLRAGEIDDTAYDGFCAAYGHDVRGWPGLDLMDRIADLGGVAFRLWDDRQHGRPLDWVPAELEVWRSG